MGRAARAFAVAAGCAALAGCLPFKPLDRSLGAGFLTREGEDVYGITVTDGVVEASGATTNEGSNSRAAFWRLADPESADQETCASWLDYPATTRQLGAVLRVRTAGGHTRAITVTNNVMYWARWSFNIHVMDSADPTPYHQVGSFDLRDVFYPNDDITQSPPHPWRLCARVVGDVVSFIVWPLSQPEPAWGDPRYGGSVTLPDGWGEPGRAGWYVGHLSPDEVAGLGDLTMTDLTEPPAAGVAPPAAVAPSAAPAADDPATDDPAVDDRATAVAPRAPTWIASAP